MNVNREHQYVYNALKTYRDQTTDTLLHNCYDTLDPEYTKLHPSCKLDIFMPPRDDFRPTFPAMDLEMDEFGHPEPKYPAFNEVWRETTVLTRLFDLKYDRCVVFRINSQPPGQTSFNSPQQREDWLQQHFKPILVKLLGFFVSTCTPQLPPGAVIIYIGYAEERVHQLNEQRLRNLNAPSFCNPQPRHPSSLPRVHQFDLEWPDWPPVFFVVLPAQPPGGSGAAGSSERERAVRALLTKAKEFKLTTELETKLYAHLEDPVVKPQVRCHMVCCHPLVPTHTSVQRLAEAQLLDFVLFDLLIR